MNDQMRPSPTCLRKKHEIFPTGNYSVTSQTSVDMLETFFIVATQELRFAMVVLHVAITGLLVLQAFRCQRPNAGQTDASKDQSPRLTKIDTPVILYCTELYYMIFHSTTIL